MSGAVSFAQAMIAKGQPPANGVHVTTALGNDRKRPKATNFKAIMAELHTASGTIQAPPVVKGAAGRALKPLDDTTAHTPFPFDAGALDKLRADQTPRFLGALTNPGRLPKKMVPHAELTAIQNRVDPKKVEALRGGKAGKPGVVVHYADRNYIADGHHRLAADHMDGKDESEVHFLDLSPVSNALKRDAARTAAWSLPMTVTKADPERQMIFGFASVATQDGRRVIDKQGDIIPVPELENAVYDFVLNSREGDDMHMQPKTSRLIESMVFTVEKCALLKIDLPKDAAGHGVEAWFVGFKVDDAPLWERHKRGERPEFSIGGAAIPVQVEA